MIRPLLQQSPIDLICGARFVKVVGMKRVKNRFTNRTISPIGVIGFVLGAGLFAYFVRKSGLNAIVSQIRLLGMGFLIIIAISAVRQVARSFA